MPDYPLEHLNTRSFEQLVQALALEVLGKQVAIFGDGPDGGREATFRGQVKYPDGDSHWIGGGTVQAKFRQRLDPEPKASADWVIEELKGEFAKLEPRRISQNFPARMCPEFYIFATNVTLSPVANIGGKDRVVKILEGFKATHGLKDYAIWDRDQICRFLDLYPGIRTTYAAWLTPGDVLTQMLKHLKMGESDFGPIMLRYLREELFDDQMAKLSQGGYTDATSILLSNVFVDLPLVVQEARNSSESTDPPARPTFLETFLEEGRKVLRPSCTQRSNPTILSPQQPVEGRVVLIGGPGQGKTTVGVYACQLLRMALLRDAAGHYAPEVERALAAIENQCTTLPTVHALRYPLRVDLKKLAESLAGNGDIPSTSLLDFLIKHISKRAGADLKKEEFRQWIAAYPWLLVLDGLDEVPASSNRKEVMDAIRSFISIEAHDRDADLLILATTRPQGYSNEFDPTLYQHLTLAPLQPDEALNYGTRLTEARHPGQHTRIEDLTSALRRATSNPAIARLMESPLQVTIMLSLIEGGGEPPEQRWKLFRDYYDVIYRREKERGTAYSEILRRYEPDMHWLHQRVGWMLQRRNAASGQTAARLTHVEFEDLVDKRLRARGHDDDEKRRTLVKEIRRAATERLVLLVGNTDHEIGFEIRSLQEFMAAEHCFFGGDECARKTLQAIAAYPYWRNVFLFIAGRIFFEKEHLVASVIDVCKKLNEPLTDAALGTIHAGSRLALTLLHDGLTRNQPENTRVLARIAAGALIGDDRKLARSMSELTHHEVLDVWKDELVKMAQVKSAALPMLPWKLCVLLQAKGHAWAEELLRDKFPWESEEVWAFMLSTLERKEALRPEFWRLFEPHMFRHSPSIWLRLARWVDHKSDFLPNPFLKHLHDLAWVESTGSEIKVMNEDGVEVGVTFRIRALKYHREWERLKCHIPEGRDAHPEWHLFRAISKFAAIPSLGELAKVIDCLGRLPPNKFWQIDWVLPWQVRYCASLLARGAMPSALRNEVLNGSLGTVDDWKQWEESLSSGISLPLLGEHREAPRITAKCLGPLLPPRGYSYSVGFDEGTNAFASALGLLISSTAVSDTELLQTLTRVCAILDADYSDWGGQMPNGIIQLIKACLGREMPIHREFVFRLIDAAASSAEARTMLSRINMRIGREWYAEGETMLKKIDGSASELLRSIDPCLDSDLNILGAMSFLPALPFAKALSGPCLVQLEAKGGAHLQAAVVLRVNGLSWKPEEAKRLAEATLDCRDAYPAHLFVWLNFVDSSGAGGPHLEAFVVALLKLLRRDENLYDLTSEAADLLVILVERRPNIEELIDPSPPH